MVKPEPEINSSVAELRESEAENFRPAHQLLEEMLNAIADGDSARAASLMREADRDHSSEPLLAQAYARCQAVIDRAQWQSAAIEQMRLDFQEDHFASAIGRFREALCLSQGLPLLKAAAENQALLHSELLLPRNWRVAESLLEETATAVPDFALEPGLQEKLRRARTEELVAIALHQADKATFTGETKEARDRLAALISAYPAEKRLAEKLAELDTPRKIARRSSADVARAATVPTAANPALPDPDTIDWQGARNFATVAGITAMLGAAAFLMWHHFGTGARAPEQHAAVVAPKVISAPPVPAPKPPASQTPAAPPPVPDVSEDAWNIIKTSDDVAALQEFLASYPASPHALRVKVKLAAIDWAKVDKSSTEALETYLRLHPNGFYRAEANRRILKLNAEKVAAITATPTRVPDRIAITQAVRAFASLPQSAMIDEPAINGDEATVRVQSLTFLLSKVDGKWQVQSSR